MSSHTNEKINFHEKTFSLFSFLPRKPWEGKIEKKKLMKADILILLIVCFKGEQNAERAENVNETSVDWRGVIDCSRQR